MNDKTFEQKPNQSVLPPAARPLLGDQFVDWLAGHARQTMQRWPVSKDLNDASVRLEKLRKFLAQLHLAEEVFWGTASQDPGLLGFTIANLSESDDPSSETALELLEKIQEQSEERAQKFFNRLAGVLAELELPAEELKKIEPKEPVRNFFSELSDFCSNSSWQTALGTIVGYEYSILEENKLISALLSNSGAQTDFQKNIERTSTEHLPIPPFSLLEKITFDEENKTLVLTGVEKQLQARRRLYDSLSKNLLA